MDEENKKFDFSDPMGMMSLITAVMADLIGVIFLFSLGIPVVGIIFFFFGIALHYVGAALVALFLWGKFKGALTKIVVGLLWAIPLPTLSLSIVAGVLLSNKFVRFIAEQVVIQAVAASTGGAGEALEGVALAGRATEAGAEVAVKAAVTAGERTAVQAGERVAAQTGERVAVKGAQMSEKAVQTGEKAAERRAEQTFSEKVEEKIKTKAEEKLSKKPEELLEKTFEKMEDMSQEDEEEEGSERILSDDIVDLR